MMTSNHCGNPQVGLGQFREKSTKNRCIPLFTVCSSALLTHLFTSALGFLWDVHRCTSSTTADQLLVAEVVEADVRMSRYLRALRFR